MTKADDQSYIAACLRLARRHRGITGTNPAVGTLLVRDGVVLGKGITAKGGRPHAEPIAIAEAERRAAEGANGATAYVSLEPCAHHGATPPCAAALIDAGVSRVVTAWIDPDRRVDGKGHEMLRSASVRVETGFESETAALDLSGYLNRKINNRPQVILKLAVSSDGKLGQKGKEISITGDLAKRYVHRMRAEYDAILVGRGTIDSDDPLLNCRLLGLEKRSPHRFVLDTNASLSPNSQLAQTAHKIPISLITIKPSLGEALVQLGVRHFASQLHENRLAVPEILEDMASAGISSLMVEGGAETARCFLKANSIDEIALFTGTSTLGKGAIASPITQDQIPEDFKLVRHLKLGKDHLHLYRRKMSFEAGME
ncbi:MAG: bifunctional diaminohydroxyphosphoribosylaminopyrimidine deaminase/5-amino-6-(5-phosphoribosylamino)uracil reductase RibD [Rhizobiaceae bacterium]